MWKMTPFSSSPRKRSDFDDFIDIFDDFFRTPSRSLRYDTFKIDVEEKDDKYEIKADLPGVKKDEIKVSYDDNTLVIAIEREEKKEEEQEERKYLHRERRFESMKRAIHLPDIDPSKMTAKHENGVLHIEAKKAEVQDQGYVIDVE